MIVGAVCCDKLTESTIGSGSHVNFIKYINRRKTFINSLKWEVAPNGIRSIERSGIAIEIVPTDDGKFRINLDGVKGRVDHAILLDAQIYAFDFVESGKATIFLTKRRRRDAGRSRE